MRASLIPFFSSPFLYWQNPVLFPSSSKFLHPSISPTWLDASGWIRGKYKCQRQRQSHSFALCRQVNINIPIHITIIITILITILITFITLEYLQIQDLNGNEDVEECENRACLNLLIGFRHHEGPWYQWDITNTSLHINEMRQYQSQIENPFQMGRRKSSGMKQWTQW